MYTARVYPPRYILYWIYAERLCAKEQIIAQLCRVPHALQHKHAKAVVALLRSLLLLWYCLLSGQQAIYVEHMAGGTQTRHP